MSNPESGLGKTPPSESSQETKESSPRLLAKVTFSRHEETFYSGIGRDITDAGIARAQDKGRTTMRAKGAPVLFGHSPRERAKGTAESIEEGAREEAGGSLETRWMMIPGLRSSDVRNKEAHARLAGELGTTQEAWADAHYYKPEFYDNPDSFETNEEKRTRMYRELDRLIGFLLKRPPEDEAPHLVFVSHYELISLLLDDVFGIKTFESTNTPSFGQHVDIELYEPVSDGSVPIHIHFNGHEKQVLFDRKLRRLIARPI